MELKQLHFGGGEKCLQNMLRCLPNTKHKPPHTPLLKGEAAQIPTGCPSNNVNPRLSFLWLILIGNVFINCFSDVFDKKSGSQDKCLSSGNKYLRRAVPKATVIVAKRLSCVLSLYIPSTCCISREEYQVSEANSSFFVLALISPEGRAGEKPEFSHIRYAPASLHLQSRTIRQRGRAFPLFTPFPPLQSDLGAAYKPWVFIQYWQKDDMLQQKLM